MQIELNIKKIFQYILIYMIIATGGSAWTSFLGNDLFVLIIFITGALYLLLNNKGAVEKKFGVMLIVSSLFCLLAMCYSTLSIGTYLNFMGKILLAYAGINIDQENFNNRFIKISYVLALISCIVFLGTQILGFESFAPLYTRLYTNPADGSYNLGNGYGLFLYRFTPLHSYRNCGMFTEPGEYAVFLAVGIFFVLKDYENMDVKSRDRIFLVLVLAMLTSQSTSGYAMLAIALVMAFFSKRIAVLHSARIWIAIIIALVIFGGYFMTLYGNTIANKIIVDGVVDLNQGTAAARSTSIMSVFEYINQHPFSILGIGFEKLQTVGLEACAGLLATFIAIGIFAFGTTHIYLFNKGWVNTKSVILYFLMLSIFLISGLSQPGTGFAVCYLMFLASNEKENERI